MIFYCRNVPKPPCFPDRCAAIPARNDTGGTLYIRQASWHPRERDVPDVLYVEKRGPVSDVLARRRTRTGRDSRQRDPPGSHRYGDDERNRPRRDRTERGEHAASPTRRTKTSPAQPCTVHPTTSQANWTASFPSSTAVSPTPNRAVRYR